MPLKLYLHQLEKMATAAGYESYYALLYEYYIVQKMSMPEVGRRLEITEGRVRKHLVRFGIPVRVKGHIPGKHGEVVMTPTLLQEITRDGVPAVAERMKVPSTSLYLLLKKVKT